MGTEDIHDAAEPQKAELLKTYYEMRAETLRMIREDSGVAQIEKLFHTINRAENHQSRHRAYTRTPSGAGTKEIAT